MADSLRLKGAKHVIKHTGDEMKLRRPKRGGDVHQVPTWWALKKTVTYTGAAIFDVNSTVGPLTLIVPVDAEGTDLGIKHNGDGTFTFTIKRGVDRVAVMSADMKTFYVEYQFSKISGGPTLKRTVNALPSAAAAISFTASSTIAGTATVGETLTATAATYTGGVGSVTTNLIFQVSDNGTSGWSFKAGNPGTASGGTATYTLQAGDESKFIRASYQVTDDNETKSSNSAATSAIASTFASRVAAADLSVVVTVADTGNGNKYQIDGVEQDGIVATVGSTILFDLSDASLTGGAGSNHPFKIYTDATKTTEVTVGVERVGDELLFTPPIAGTFSYQCANHADMGGTITVS